MKKTVTNFTIFFFSFILLHFTASVLVAEDFPAKEIYEKWSKSVVLIVAIEGSMGNAGAGSIITKDGLVITNAHVIYDKERKEPYSKINIYLRPEKLTGNTRTDLVNSSSGKLISYSIDLDLALLKIEKVPFGTQVVELADSSEIMTGETVMAIGHPEQGGMWSLTVGRISGELKDYGSVKGKDVFQTDTSINRGNSGGPLLDKRGYMVAVNSNIARIGKDALPITGVNFAIKASVVKNWIDSTREVKIAYGTKPLDENKNVYQVAENKETAPAEEKKPATVQPEKKVIVAQPEKKTEEEKPAIVQPEKKGEEKTATQESEGIQKRPYTFDELLSVASEMEDMMTEMKNRTNRQ